MMNIHHMRYALEVERQGSISKAADRLFMNQPNLSKAIRELESALGIAIFSRTTKGVTVTAEGARFLSYARSILAQFDELEAHYRPSAEHRQSFRISVPRSSYIAGAFTDFVSELDMALGIDLYFSETNTVRAVQNITEEGFKLGVIRYRTLLESYFLSFLNEHDLGHREILAFESLILCSRSSPLAAQSSITREDLVALIEITHGDLRIPNQPQEEAPPQGDAPVRCIHVYERGSQLDLLTRNPNTYMWVSPIPSDILERGQLVLRRCSSANLHYKDVLIYPRGYSYTALEKAFLKKLDLAAAQARLDLDTK